MKKAIYKIARFLGIRFCNGCGRCIWFSKDMARWADSPDDSYSAPICGGCRYYYEEKL